MINNNSKNKLLIASLTSYGYRINTVNLCIETILNQTLKPDKIILWLSKKEFKLNELPKQLLKLQKKGLKINFCEDLKSYKKLIPSLKKYPNDIIITFDDDIYYKNDLIEKLYKAYLNEPSVIHCARGSKIKFDNNLNVLKYNLWNYENDFTSNLLIFPTGAGGILYPPNCFNTSIFDKKIFMQLAPHADDIWFKAMSLLNNTKCKIINQENNEYMNVHEYLINNTQDDALYHDNLNGGNDKQLQRVFKKYDIYNILKKEYLNQIKIKYSNEFKNFLSCLNNFNSKIILHGFNDFARLIYEEYKHRINFILDTCKVGKKVDNLTITNLNNLEDGRAKTFVICALNTKAIKEIRKQITIHTKNPKIIDNISTKIKSYKPLKIYAGDIIPKDKVYDKYLGLSLTQNNQNHIQWDITDLPLPFKDNSVDVFQSEDVFEHIEYEKLPKIINEIYRILKPNSLFRLSMPDYNCDVLYKRSIYNFEGNLVFDPGGGGTYEQPGHVWFPTYTSVKSLLKKTNFYNDGKIEFLHYYLDKDNYITKDIDYTKGYVQRTPDNDDRVKIPYRPMSIVIDLYKGDS